MKGLLLRVGIDQACSFEVERLVQRRTVDSAVFFVRLYLTYLSAHASASMDASQHANPPSR